MPGAAPVASHVSQATAVRTVTSSWAPNTACSNAQVDDDLEVGARRRAGGARLAAAEAAVAAEERVEDVAEAGAAEPERIAAPGRRRRPRAPNWSYRRRRSGSDSISYAAATSLNCASAPVSSGFASGWSSRAQPPVGPS